MSDATWITLCPGPVCASRHSPSHPAPRLRPWRPVITGPGASVLGAGAPTPLQRHMPGMAKEPSAPPLGAEPGLHWEIITDAQNQLSITSSSDSYFEDWFLHFPCIFQEEASKASWISLYFHLLLLQPHCTSVCSCSTMLPPFPSPLSAPEMK